MRKKVVCAVLNFKTPTGNLKKVVNWYFYELNAELTPSKTSYLAFVNFGIHGKEIIEASPVDLQYLDSISFYEYYYYYEDNQNQNPIVSRRANQTRELQIKTTDNGPMIFMVKQK